jgi:putative ABC transport system permease protein
VLFFVLAESLTIAIIGGFIGLLLAILAVPGISKGLNGILPNLVLTPTTLGFGLVVAVAVGIISGLLPGFTAMRMRVVNALRRV